ncbi:MAG: hypothetical protein IPO29_01195 [Anaerolineae bacterium]|jgi:hypothetical protein|nr:hypothetical protein [Anaerolineae bacterium]HQY25463.1 hypothetical protein [Thermoflexales bacterium]HRA52597.1 hypothetical protein [Thermoflexales bacterium]
MTRPRYRPTYTPSETNRSLTRRLTPLAWICLVLLGLMIAGVLSLFAQQPGAYVRAQAGSAGPIAAEQGPAQIAPAPTLVPAIGPDPTNEGDVVRATAAAPAAASLEAPWAGAMRRLADGQIAAPAAASQAAREAVRQALERELALGRSGVSGADAVAGRAALLQATRIGSYLAAGELALRDAAPGPAWQALSQGVIERISIYAFSLDGLECEALVDLRDARVTLFDGRGIPAGQEPRQDGLWRYRLRYDLAAGRWKLADLIEYAPG